MVTEYKPDKGKKYSVDWGHQSSGYWYPESLAKVRTVCTAGDGRTPHPAHLSLPLPICPPHRPTDPPCPHTHTQPRCRYTQVGDTLEFSWDANHGVWRIPTGECPEVRLAWDSSAGGKQGR